jgi:hypothetical protein
MFIEEYGALGCKAGGGSHRCGDGGEQAHWYTDPTMVGGYGAQRRDATHWTNTQLKQWAVGRAPPDCCDKRSTGGAGSTLFKQDDPNWRRGAALRTQFEARLQSDKLEDLLTPFPFERERDGATAAYKNENRKKNIDQMCVSSHAARAAAPPSPCPHRA